MSESELVLEVLNQIKKKYPYSHNWLNSIEENNPHTGDWDVLLELILLGIQKGQAENKKLKEEIEKVKKGAKIVVRFWEKKSQILEQKIEQATKFLNSKEAKKDE